MPPPDTSMLTFGSTLLYSSAQTCARLTIVSDPLTWMVTFLPEVESRREVSLVLSGLQPVCSRLAASASAAPAWLAVMVLGLMFIKNNGEWFSHGPSL